MRRCAGITLPSHASTATRGFGELARNDNRGAKLIRPQASRVVAIPHAAARPMLCAQLQTEHTSRDAEIGEGVAFGCAGAFRIGLQSGVHVACIGPPSALYRASNGL